jgi:hypothetical protein
VNACLSDEIGLTDAYVNARMFSLQALLSELSFGGGPKARQCFKRCGCNPAAAGFENNQSYSN